MRGQKNIKLDKDLLNQFQKSYNIEREYMAIMTSMRVKIS